MGRNDIGEASISLMKDAQGQPIGFRGIVRDITERKQAEEGLKDSEERYRKLFENAIDGIVLADLERGIIIDCNKVIGGLVEREKTELIGQSQQILHPPEDSIGEVSRTFAQHRFDKEGQVLETQVITKTGEIKQVEIKANILELKGRKVLQGIFRDITERKRSEEALRESEERYRNILGNIEDGYYEVDIAGNFTFFNNSLFKILGYPKEEMMGMNNRVYMDKETARRVYQAYNQVYTTGEPLKAFGYKITRKDGTERFLESHVSLLKNTNGERIGFRGIARDMTERKQTEEALRTEKQNFQTLSENAPFGMVTIDQDGIFRYINPKFKEIFGYDLTDVPDGRTWFRKAYPDPTYRHQVTSDWINDLERTKPGEKRPRVFTVKCKDGTEKIINFIPVQLEAGENLMTCEDITERIQAEEALRESGRNTIPFLRSIEDGYYEVDYPGISPSLMIQPVQNVWLLQR